MKNESALLSAAENFDKEALTAIFDIYAPAIYTYVLRFCHDPIDSDKIVGNVFAQLLQEFAAGQGPLTDLRSYLYQIAYHLVLDRVPHNQHFADPKASIQGKGKTTTEEHVLMDALVSALNNGLSELQRHVLVLRFLEDFSLRETAAIIGKNVNQIKVIQNRGIAKLRKSLGLQTKSKRQELSFQSDTS